VRHDGLRGFVLDMIGARSLRHAPHEIASIDSETPSEVDQQIADLHLRQDALEDAVDLLQTRVDVLEHGSQDGGSAMATGAF
jgi:hypothetical protein